MYIIRFWKGEGRNLKGHRKILMAVDKKNHD
jgi:hypothetical protein